MLKIVSINCKHKLVKKDWVCTLPSTRRFIGDVQNEIDNNYWSHIKFRSTQFISSTDTNNKIETFLSE